MSVTAQFNKQRGFTIVELLIVIVVIAILAAISIVAYNGIQQRARDTQRKQDISTLAKALELYYIEKGQFPYGGGSTSINTAWTTTADASWSNLETQLKPYVNSIPRDPVSTPKGAGSFPWDDPTAYDYSYAATSAPSCGLSGSQQGYRIIYRLEGAQEDKLIGNCSTNPAGPNSGSNYRVMKN